MIKVFLGFDSNETVAYYVAAHSILRHSSVPVSITPLKLSQLPMYRERTKTQSTEFSFSRFLVPWLCGFKDKAIFLDSDVLVRTDIAELWNMDIDGAVGVVKHDYVPKTHSKFLDQPQTSYRRKNWSSVMVFNNQYCHPLTPDYVNKASGMELHQFQWLQDDAIAAIDPDWNHLVGEYEPNPGAKIAHFTLGTPCFAKYSHCEFSDEWFEERKMMTHYNREGEFSLPAKEAA